MPCHYHQKDVKAKVDLKCPDTARGESGPCARQRFQGRAVVMASAGNLNFEFSLWSRRLLFGQREEKHASFADV